MLQAAISKSQIQDITVSWKDGAIELSLGESRNHAPRLSTQQARALAGELILQAYQAERVLCALAQRKNSK